VLAGSTLHNVHDGETSNLYQDGDNAMAQKKNTSGSSEEDKTVSELGRVEAQRIPAYDGRRPARMTKRWRRRYGFGTVEALGAAASLGAEVLKLAMKKQSGGNRMARSCLWLLIAERRLGQKGCRCSRWPTGAGRRESVARASEFFCQVVLMRCL
jgi:hypothetical protein